MKIHIVFGDIGEYEDSQDWIDSIYLDKNKAEERQKLLEQASESKNQNYMREIDPEFNFNYVYCSSYDKPRWSCVEYEVIE